MKSSHFPIFLAGAILIGSCGGEQSPNDIFHARRAAFSDSLQTGTAVIPATTRNKYLNKTFYYLTGLTDTSATLVFNLADGGKGTVYCKPAPDATTASPSGISFRKQEELAGVIKQLAEQKGRLVYSPRAVDFKKRYLSEEQSFVNADSLADKMRIIKDTAEIAALKKACLLTARGINHMLTQIRPGMQEKDISRLLREGFDQNGGQGVSFLQAASGENGTSVHAGVTEKVLEPTDMVVIDVGAYSDRYTSDISRTFPANGKFTPEQKCIYDIVLKAAEEEAKNFLPGKSFVESENIGQNVLIDELYRLGLVTDKESRWQRSFYIQHSFSHFIGLDVHDVWYDFLKNVPASQRVYEPGMVITLEPGLYFPENYLDKIPDRLKNSVSEKEFRQFVRRIKNTYKKYAGIGVRIEDCLLITPEGHENLTSATPVEPEEIEALMASGTK